MLCNRAFNVATAFPGASPKYAKFRSPEERDRQPLNPFKKSKRPIKEEETPLKLQR